MGPQFFSAVSRRAFNIHGSAVGYSGIPAPRGQANIIVLTKPMDVALEQFAAKETDPKIRKSAEVALGAAVSSYGPLDLAGGG